MGESIEVINPEPYKSSAVSTVELWRSLCLNCIPGHAARRYEELRANYLPNFVQNGAQNSFCAAELEHVEVILWEP